MRSKLFDGKYLFEIIIYMISRIYNKNFQIQFLLSNPISNISILLQIYQVEFILFQDIFKEIIVPFKSIISFAL